MPSRSGRRGHLETLPSGSFRAVVFVGIDPPTGSRRYVRETAKTRVEAEKALTRLQREVDEDKQPKSAITVATAIEQWMEVAELSETTRDRYEDLIRIYILPTFGTMQAGRLDAELLERYYARLHRCRDLCRARPPQGHVHRPLSTSTTRKIHYIIRGALERAVRWGYVSVNRAAMAQPPTKARTRPDPPNATEAAALLTEASRDPEWGLLLWLTMVPGSAVTLPRMVTSFIGCLLGLLSRWDAASPQRGGSGSRRDGGVPASPAPAWDRVSDQAQRGSSHPAAVRRVHRRPPDPFC